MDFQRITVAVENLMFTSARLAYSQWRIGIHRGDPLELRERLSSHGVDTGQLHHWQADNQEDAAYVEDFFANDCGMRKVEFSANDNGPAHIVVF